MSEPIAVTGDTFEEEVLKSEVPVLVDFTAAWCGPCRQVAPVLDQIAADEAGRLRVISLDVDENPATQARYGVLSMPTLMLFKGVEAVTQLVGARPRSAILRQL